MSYRQVKVFKRTIIDTADDHHTICRKLTPIQCETLCPYFCGLTHLGYCMVAIVKLFNSIHIPIK